MLWPASASPRRTGRGWPPVPLGRGLPQRPGPDPLMPASPGSPYTAATNRVHRRRHRAQLHHNRSRNSWESCPGTKARSQDDSDRTYCHAADRVFPFAVAPAPLPAVRAARVRHPDGKSRSPVTAQKASGGNSGQDDPDAAGVLDLNPPGRPEMGAIPRIIQRAAPRQTAMPERRGGVGRVRPGRRRMRLPGNSVSLSGITLSHEGVRIERARSRRSARLRLFQVGGYRRPASDHAHQPADCPAERALRHASPRPWAA